MKKSIWSVNYNFDFNSKHNIFTKINSNAKLILSVNPGVIKYSHKRLTKSVSILNTFCYYC